MSLYGFMGTGLVALGAGLFVGWELRSVKADRDAERALRAQVEYAARNLVRRDLAEQAIQAAQALREPIVKETQHAVAKDLAQPASCPASGILADLVVPGVGDRVRWLRAKDALGDAPAGYHGVSGSADPRW